jgi:hypothetical protein
MVTFTINQDNNIVAYANAEEAAQAGDSTTTAFDSQASLAKASADWPLSRFVEIWNSIPGNSEVKKFENRDKAVGRIWKAIQGLAAPVPEATTPAKTAKSGKKGKAGKHAEAKKQARKGTGDRSNKKAEVIAMLKRAKGATLAEIMAATNWQAHTVRGFVSILASKGGHSIESAKNPASERVYKIQK